MVMAGSEGVPGPTTDETLSNRLQWLRQRREALQEKLSQKNNELKNLCIEEAELTGVLPPEIPLEPGESPPNFRKRAGTNLNFSQNLINKLKTSGAEESVLEIERQAQINIAESALAILNNVAESKAVRRKHRSIYQQSQRRLQELNAQLNFIRQSHGGAPRHGQSSHIPLHSSQPHLQMTAKHRTKKPRPPLDNAGADLSPKVEPRGLLQEGGISLSPLGPEHNFNAYPGYEFQDVASHGYQQTGSSNNQNRATYHAPSPSEHRRSDIGLISSNNNSNSSNNNNVYVAPDHFRGRAYSQGGSSCSISPHHFPERPQRLIMPNTYTEEERQQIYYRNQMRLKKQQELEEQLRAQQFSEPRYMDNETHRRSTQIPYHENDLNAIRFEGQIPDYPTHYNHGKTQPPILRPRDSAENNILVSPEHKPGSKPSVDTYVPPGYWMRLDDEIVWCTEDPMAAERFGSLDRRKQNVPQHQHHHHHHHHPSNAETQSRYHTVTIGGKSPVIPHSRPHPMQPPMQSPDIVAKPVASNRMLLRTQSLGSVESWQTPSVNDNCPSTEGRDSADDVRNKPKEKEWYETALDAPRLARRASQHNPLAPGPPPPPKERAPPVRSNSIPSNRRAREQPIDEQRPPVPPSRFVENRMLEIPAESKPLSGSQENGNEAIIPLNSPTNHTIVQPGKYQPYREETKPFEMSDFYKYSTKFRKRIEANVTNEQQQQQQQQQQQSQAATNSNTQNDQNQPSNPMQRIPVQRNACPPYNLR